MLIIFISIKLCGIFSFLTHYKVHISVEIWHDSFPLRADMFPHRFIHFLSKWISLSTDIFFNLYTMNSFLDWTWSFQYQKLQKKKEERKCFGPEFVAIFLKELLASQSSCYLCNHVHIKSGFYIYLQLVMWHWRMNYFILFAKTIYFLFITFSHSLLLLLASLNTFSVTHFWWWKCFVNVSWS